MQGEIFNSYLWNNKIIHKVSQLRAENCQFWYNKIIK
jgi:hypothetical protein